MNVFATLERCDESSLAHWNQEASAAPELEERLAGRTSGGSRWAASGSAEYVLPGLSLDGQHFKEVFVE